MNSLLTEINTQLNETTEHFNAINKLLIEFFGDDLSEVDAKTYTWTQQLNEVESAASGRAAELDWIQGMSSGDQSSVDDYLKKSQLSMQGDVQPNVGDAVLFNNQVAWIVDLDEQGQQVMIRDKTGRETVVKNSSLTTPRPIQVKGKKATSWQVK